MQQRKINKPVKRGTKDVSENLRRKETWRSNDPGQTPISQIPREPQ